MLTRKVLALVWPLGFVACAAVAETPLSAIDWLSDSINAPPSELVALPGPGVSNNALPEEVTVAPIGQPSPDAIGLLPAATTGLPADLWGASRASDIAQRFRADRVDLLPAMQDLLYTLLLAELDPPQDSGPVPQVFLARIDTLLALGALEQADAMMQRAGTSDPQIFRRAFDTALLLRNEDHACEVIRSTPSLSPTFPARIFCLARGGDWDAAALALETGTALGYVSGAEEQLLARFLHPELSDDAEPLAFPGRPSPLVFRMLEAIGEPVSTTTLPRAFAHADLHSSSGWKAQVEAAERLTRSGAMDPNRLLGLYTARKAAASGGVWNRVQAVQRLEEALTERDVARIETTLPLAWSAMAAVELEVPFARLFADRIAKFDLTGDPARLAYELRLVAGHPADVSEPETPDLRHAILYALSQGQPGPLGRTNDLTLAVQDGFRTLGVPVRLQSLTGQNRMGEAMLRALDLFVTGSRGDLDELTDALVFFRSVGLEQTARRAALELLLLERRG